VECNLWLFADKPEAIRGVAKLAGLVSVRDKSRLRSLTSGQNV